MQAMHNTQLENTQTMRWGNALSHQPEVEDSILSAMAFQSFKVQ